MTTVSEYNQALVDKYGHVVAEYNQSLIDEYGQEFFDAISERRIADIIALKLLDRVNKMEVNRILEIGRYKGYSLGWFRKICPNAEIVSIDPQLHPEISVQQEDFGNVILIHGTSDNLNQIAGTFDLVFIDGDHHYEEAKKDWENVQPFIKDNTAVIFDDLFHYWECGKVFDELQADYENERLHSIGIIYGKKK